MLKLKSIAGLLFSSVFLVSASWAAHPLITDDAETQGKGKYQLELNGQYNWDREDVDGVTMKTTGGLVNATLTYGVAEKVDLAITLPYQWGKVEGDGVIPHNEKGISDAVLEAKWQFYEKEGLGLAAKPGIRFPTGNHDKDLGSGRVGGQLFLIGSKEVAPWAFHVNLGYIRNENKLDERTDLWHASLAAERYMTKKLKLIANIGQERNPDIKCTNHPAFLIGGLIYSIAEGVDLDGGVKYGLTSSETDWSLLTGVTIRF